MCGQTRRASAESRGHDLVQALLTRGATMTRNKRPVVCQTQSTLVICLQHCSFNQARDPAQYQCKTIRHVLPVSRDGHKRLYVDQRVGTIWLHSLSHGLNLVTEPSAGVVQPIQEQII